VVGRARVHYCLYAAHLGRYGATYGTLAGVVVFLLWLWILNLTLLFGAEFNVQLGRLPARSR
jgi:membrane protein